MKVVRERFGDAPLTGIKPQHVYKYIDMRNAPSVARREIALLSHALTKAIQWGYIDRHPFKGEIRLERPEPRNRYIEDWEIVECLSISSLRKKGSILTIHAYIRIKLLTGMSRGDLLRLTMGQIQSDGIHIERHKTAKKARKKTIYEWSDELRQAVDDAKAARPALSPYLFCNKQGRGYVNEKTGKVYGWESMWQRFMKRVLTETKLTERFTEHDLRAKCASDAGTLEQARALLSHVDSRITERVYRRKPERVKPLR